MPDSAFQGLILVKKETTYGTDAVPTVAANAIATINPQFTTDSPPIERNQILRDSISRLSFVVGRKLARITFGVELKGSGTAGTAPRYGPCLIACGMSETIAAGVSVTYAPVNSGFESVTIWWFDGSKKYTLTGAFGTCRIIEEVNQFGRYEFDFTGLWTLPTDATPLVGAVYDNTKPQPIQNLGLLLGAYSPVAATLNIDMGVEIAERLDFNAAEGLRGVRIIRRAVGGTIDPETVTEATHPFYSNFKNATEVALVGNIVGATAGNKVAVTGSKIQYEPPGQGERNSLRTMALPFRMNPSTDAASDEIQIVLT